MLNRIIHEYEQHGETCNMAQLVSEAANSAAIVPVSGEEFHEAENSLQTDFLAFIATQGVVASGNHPIMARSRRYVSHVNMFTPIFLASNESARDLQAVPFVANPPIDTCSPEVIFTAGEAPHFYGFALSFLQPHQILKHAVIARPWLNIASRKIGLIRRAAPDLYADVTEKQLRYQKTFQQAIAEILAKTEDTSTGS